MIRLKNIIPLAFLFHSICAVLLGEVSDNGHNTTARVLPKNKIAYAPVGSASPQELEKVWDSVRDILDLVEGNERIIMYGDLNGWVGTKRNSYEAVLGPYGDKRVNDAENAESTFNKTFFVNPEEIGEYAEGDILVANDHGRAGFKNQSLLWPNATIPYNIEGNYSAQQLETINYAMHLIQIWTCFRFVPYSDQVDYVVIRNDKNAGCASYVGRIGGRQEILLEAPLCFAKIGTTLHELLHAVGLLHEHNRFDRYIYLDIIRDNIQSGKHKFFRKYRRGDVHNFDQRYNYNSVMHFSAYVASKNGEKTIVPTVNKVEIGQRDNLGVTDVMAVSSMYKCNVTEILAGTRSTSYV